MEHISFFNMDRQDTLDKCVFNHKECVLRTRFWIMNVELWVLR